MYQALLDKFDFEKGEVLLLDKPLYWTSFDLVNKIKSLLKNRLGLKNIKVGHAGTLDPLATGLVIVCTGKKTKEIDQFLGSDKEYIAGIEFGATTPSFDLETEIDQRFPTEHITKEDIEKTLIQSFFGEISQQPPMFSAKKVNGKRAYESARKGIDVEIKPVIITIKQIELLQFLSPSITIKMLCSKGTYIRAFARDLGIAMNSGAHLKQLRRTTIGEYSIEKALTMKEFEEIFQNKQ